MGFFFDGEFDAFGKTDQTLESDRTGFGTQ
jgi:hypothetical protein